MALRPLDNAGAIARPEPVSLEDSGLAASGAFAPRTGETPGDLLLLFGGSAGKYYHDQSGWHRSGSARDVGTTTFLEPGSGFTIRKSPKRGATVFWQQAATYPE